MAVSFRAGITDDNDFGSATGPFSYSVDPPSGIQENDLWIVSLSGDTNANDSFSIFPVPSGWTAVGPEMSTANSWPHVRSLRKLAAASQGAVNFTIAPDASTMWQLRVASYAFSGVDQTTPIGNRVSDTSGGNNVSSRAVPSLTIQNDGSIAVVHVGSYLSGGATGSISLPGSMTTVRATSSNWVSQAVGYQAVNAGSFAPGNVTWSPSEELPLIEAFEIIPAAAPSADALFDPAIFDDAIFDTGSAPAGTTYYFSATINATATPTLLDAMILSRPVTVSATGTPTLTRLIRKTFSVAASGTASLTRLVRVAKSVAATGAATLARTVRLAFTTTGTGTVSAAQSLVTGLAYTASVTITGTVTLGRTIRRTFAASATGTVSAARAMTYRVASAVTATGTASLVKLIRKVFSTAATGTVSVVKRVRKAFSTAATGTVSATRGFVFRQSGATTGTGTASSAQQYIVAPAAIGIRIMVRNITRTLVRALLR